MPDLVIIDPDALSNAVKVAQDALKAQHRAEMRVASLEIDLEEVKENYAALLIEQQGYVADSEENRDNRYLFGSDTSPTLDGDYNHVDLATELTRARRRIRPRKRD